MDHLGIDDFKANHMEFVNGYSTGRVMPPVMASATKATVDTRICRARKYQPFGFVRIFRQHLGPADAVDRRASGRGLSGLSVKADCVAARLGDLGFEVGKFAADMHR